MNKSVAALIFGIFCWALSAAAGATEFQVSDEGWAMEYSHELILIPSGDLIIPIETKAPTVTLSNEKHGRFMFSRETVRAVTRSEAVAYQYSSNKTFGYRPTLFISICGMSMEANFDGGGTCLWQNSLDNELQELLSEYQYKHFRIDWDTHSVNRAQVRDLGALVKDFLNARIDSWDVVIIGNSRGGVFGHDLTKELVGVAKLADLHTFLLDPTASATYQDMYPASKHDASPTDHYASLFYDGNAFFEGAEVGTVGDRDIPGYDNYGNFSNSHLIYTTHEEFAGDWIAHPQYGLERALDDIKSKKDTGTFVVDGSSGMEVVKLSRPHGISFDGDVSLQGGGHIMGELSIADLPESVFIDATLASDSVEVAGATGVAVSSVIIKKDFISVAESSIIADYTTTISSQGISMDVTSFHTNAEFSISSGGEFNISISIGPVNIDSDVNILDPLGLF
ncbi:hypothetical protein ACFL2V_01130 [Pseudomonadota bacterium]